MEPVLEAKQEELDEFRDTFGRLRAEISKRIVGMTAIVDGVLTCLLAGGHVLLEGVPGLGKTLLVRTLAEVLHLKFSRIQFTPDLMPADLIGTNIVTEDERGRRVFEFQPGPVFGNIILADEINRATPKTQSALLEAMQETSVTVSGVTHQLDTPFFVLATQNPLEMEGTYPLPEAQLDRFLFKLQVEYPSAEEVATILDRTTQREMPAVERVVEGPQINALRGLARDIPIAEPVQAYAIRMVMATHPASAHATELAKRYVRYGASPRGAQALILGGKIRAILDERYNVSHDDVRAMAHQSLRHRMILNFEGEAEGITTDEILDDIIKRLKD
jgi:MoxR-like ATPase